MTLKHIKVIDRREPDKEKTISVNVDKVVIVQPVGEDDSEIILDGGETLRTGHSYKESIKSLS